MVYCKLLSISESVLFVVVSFLYNTNIVIQCTKLELRNINRHSHTCSFSIPDPGFTGDVLGLTFGGTGEEDGLGAGSGSDS